MVQEGSEALEGSVAGRATWATKKLFLTEKPRFTYATHTSAERAVFDDFHRDHLGYRLYAVLPHGTKISVNNAQQQFCIALLAACKGSERNTANAEQLLRATETVSSVAKSNLIV